MTNLTDPNNNSTSNNSTGTNISNSAASLTMNANNNNNTTSGGNHSPTVRNTTLGHHLFAPRNSILSNTGMSVHPHQSPPTVMAEDEEIISTHQTSVVESSSVDVVQTHVLAEEYVVSPIRAIKSHPWDHLPHLISILIHGILFPLQTIAMGYIPFMQWGPTTRDIIQYTIKNLYTFGLHFLPYDGALAFCILFTVLEMVWLILVYCSKLMYGKESKWAKRISFFTKYLTVFVFILSIPMASLYATFWSCNYASEQVQSSVLGASSTVLYYLKTYPSVECWSGLNASFAAISLLMGFSIHMIVVPVFFVLCISNASHVLFPTFKKAPGCFVVYVKRAFFSSLKPLVIVAIVVSYQIYVWIQQMIPCYEEYTYLYPIFYICLCLLNIMLIIWYIPFSRISENSYDIALNFGKIGIGIVSLVCSIQNVQQNGDIGLIYFGVSVGVFILFFTIGFIVSFFAFKLYLKHIQNLVGEKLQENPSELLEEVSQNTLAKVLQFSLPMFNDSSLVALSRQVVSEVIRNKIVITDTHLVNVVSCTLFKYKDSRYSINKAIQMIMNQMRRKVNIFDRIYLSLQKYEKEYLKKKDEIKPGMRRNEEIDKKLSDLYKKQQKVISLQKTFWKYILNDSMEDTDAILQTSSALADYIMEISTKFSDLLSQHASNVTILRHYARYAEKILFQMDLSEMLNAQAAMLEEEEEAHNRKHVFKTVSVRRYSTRPSDVDQITHTKTFPQHEPNNCEDDLDEAKNFDEEQMKTKSKDTFRGLIHKQPDFRWILCLIVVVPCYVILGITGGLLGEIIQSTNRNGFQTKGYKSNVWMYYDMCDAANIPYYVMVDIRTLQKLKLYSNNTVYMNKIQRESTQRFNNYNIKLKTMLSTYSASSDNLIQSVVKGYQQKYHTILIPAAISDNSTEQVLPSAKQVTLIEIYSMLTNTLEQLIQQDEDARMNTKNNFPFMFFWENRQTIPSTIATFCSEIIDNNRNHLIEQLRDFVLGLSIAMFSFVGVSCGIFAIIIYKFRDRERLIKLFKKLPKDDVGKVYHDLRSDEKHSLDGDKKKYTMKWMRNPVIAVPSLQLLAFALGSVAFFAFIYDSTNNMNIQYNSMLKLRNSVDIQVDYHKGLFNLLELIRDNSENNLLVNTTATFYDLSITIRSLFDNFLIFSRGDDVKGYNPIRSYSTDIEHLMLSNTCNMYNSNQTQNSTDALALHHSLWNSSFSLQENLEFFQCLSIEELMGYISSTMEQLKEETFRQIFTPTELIEKFVRIHLSLSLAFRGKVDKVLLLLVNVIDTIVSMIVSISVTSFIIILCFIINYLVYILWKVYVKEMRQLRQMFHFLPFETLENEEIFMDYIMNFTLAKKKKSKIYAGMSEGEGINSYSLLNRTLDSCVDGTIIFNQDGIVENINQPALSMFGIKSQSDIIGMPFSSLFISKETIDRKLSDIVKSQ
ncbi:hypothetical protein C9374_014326, partial [Naegleria lovaniensis]